MNLYIWNNTDQLTHSYHSGGGIAAIAATIEQAREMIAAGTPELSCSALTDEPDRIISFDRLPEPEIWLFPDTGCC